MLSVQDLARELQTQAEQNRAISSPPNVSKIESVWTPAVGLVPEQSPTSRFELFLRTLDHPAGRLSEAQIARVRSIWAQARSAISGLRPPTTGLSEDDDYFLSWSFRDLPGVMLEINVLRDGRIEWSYSDRYAGFATGTAGEPEKDLPREALTHLRAFWK